MLRTIAIFSIRRKTEKETASYCCDQNVVFFQSKRTTCFHVKWWVQQIHGNRRKRCIQLGCRPIFHIELSINNDFDQCCNSSFGFWIFMCKWEGCVRVASKRSTYCGFHTSLSKMSLKPRHDKPSNCVSNVFPSSSQMVPQSVPNTTTLSCLYAWPTVVLFSPM